MIKKNDEICFLREENLKEFYYKKVKNLFVFDSYNELCDSLDVSLCGFDSKEELIKTMTSIYKDKLDKYKVVAIEVQ